MGRKPISLKFVITATLIGNTLEWYDVATFGFLVPLFAKLFFPHTTELLAINHALVMFGFGSILRPIGGILFGYIGDRYGRRKALISTVLLMTFPVFMIAFLPTYWQIGATATFLLACARLLQGMAAGGEFPGAVTFLVESAPQEKKGFYGSFVYFGVSLGVFLGGIDFYLLGLDMNKENFANWGWRILFIVGGLLGLVAFLMRRKLHETPVFQGIRESHETLHDPIKNLFLVHKMGLVKLIGMEILETLGFNLIVAFSVAYYNKVLNLHLEHSIGLSLLGLLVLLVAIPIGGWFTMKWGTKNLAISAAWGFLFFSLPLFWMIQHDAYRIYGIIFLGILLSAYMSATPQIYCDLFPAKVRYSGIGIGYNLTIALIGGFSPLLSYELIQHTEWTMAPAILLMGGAVIALFTLRGIRKSPI